MSGLLPGTPVCGMWGLFDADRGDPATPRPYAEVTPSRVGRSLLPWRCPLCGEVAHEMDCPETRRGYSCGGWVWCPRCRGRYVLDLAGTPLASALPAGVDVAPALVDRGDGRGARLEGAPGIVEAVAGALLGGRRGARELDALAAGQADAVR